MNFNCFGESSTRQSGRLGVPLGIISSHNFIHYIVNSSQLHSQLHSYFYKNSAVFSKCISKTFRGSASGAALPRYPRRAMRMVPVRSILITHRLPNKACHRVLRLRQSRKSWVAQCLLKPELTCHKEHVSAWSVNIMFPWWMHTPVVDETKLMPMINSARFHSSLASHNIARSAIFTFWRS